MVEKRLPQLPDMAKNKGSKTAIVYRQRTDNWDGSSEGQTLTPTRSTSPFQTHLSPYPTPSQSSSRRPSDSPSISSTPSRDQGSLSQKKGLWNKLSTSPAPHTPSAYPASPASDSMNEFGATSSSIPPGPGLVKKRSSGQLLSNLNRGLSRVGSVMKRSSSSPGPPTPVASPRSTPKRQGSKLGLSKQGSIRRQVEHGSWRGRKLADGPEAVQEENEEEDGVQRDVMWQDVRRNGEAESGDEGIGKPFNVNHDLHISPDLENLPTEWIAKLRAQGMTEGELLMISSARKRQIAGKQKGVNPIKEGELIPSGFIPLKDRPERRMSGTRKMKQPKGLPQRQRSYKSSTSPSSTKQRLPALMHLDDTRPSLDVLPALDSGPSRASSILPSPPPSAFASGSRPAPSRRLSDQLRGFASLNLDEVGSWADDVLDVMQQSKGDTSRNGPVCMEIDAVIAESGANDKGLGDPISPRSPGTIKRVPVPLVEGARTSVDKESNIRTPDLRYIDQNSDTCPSTTMEGLKQPISPAIQASRHVPSGEAGTDVMSTPQATKTPMMASHSHSQSLSTAEDQEIRTPITAEDDHVHTAVVPPLYPRPGQRWRSKEGMGWRSPDNEKKRVISSCAGKLGEAINLSSADLSRRSEEVPITPTQPTSTYLTLTSPSRPSVVSPKPEESDFDLSFPSPLRPPPNPHVSLPASASDTDDNFSRPMSFSEVDPDASPILRGGVLSIGSDLMRCDSEDWGLRKSSGTSEPVKRGSGNEGITSRANGESELAYNGQGVDQIQKGSEAQTPPTFDQSPAVPPQSATVLPESYRPGSESEEDHLSPLPPPLAHNLLSHRTSSRSLTATERESMALSTFSGESDADYSRDSMLGARVYTAQKCEVGRMSIFSLSGYMEEEGGEAGKAGKQEG